MPSISAPRTPTLAITQTDLTRPRNIALGGIAATSIVGGGILGAIKGSPLKGLAIGAAVAGVALGAALLGHNALSRPDGYCDYYGDPDCDYPGNYPPIDYEPYDPYPYDPYPYDPSYPGTGGGHYPGGATSPGDD